MREQTLDLRRRWMTMLLAGVVGGFLILAVLLMTQWLWLGVLFFVYLTACGLMLARLRCPRCGQPVLWRPLLPESQLVGYWSPLIPTRCLRCGLPLS
jgi:hypothetical protein